MDIILENIGIIEKSNIHLDGLTVVTGQNNSGKTTVGKVVYSLLDAVSDIQSKAESDRADYISKQIEKALDALQLLRFVRYTELEGIDILFEKECVLYELLSKSSPLLRKQKSAQETAVKLIEELKGLNYQALSENEIFKGYARRFVLTDAEDKSIESLFAEQIEKSVQILNKLLETLKKDPALVDYTRQSIAQTLKLEFDSQIQPIAYSAEQSRIQLKDNNGVTCFDIKISQNDILNEEIPVFTSAPYKKVYFVDNPFVLDTLSEMSMSMYYRRSSWHASKEIDNTILNTNRLMRHSSKLVVVCKNEDEKNLIEEGVLKESLVEIKRLIDEVLPGEFNFQSNDNYYVVEEKKLKITNMAAGSKMFSILKLLLNKGELDDGTMLILDEPEAHLHPEWQNKFAEIIVLLAKVSKVNILLTSHSPNFVLAIEAYMRKHEIQSLTNFYQTKALENGAVEYQCVNENMEQIYAAFMHSLSEVKALRDRFL